MISARCTGSLGSTAALTAAAISSNPLAGNQVTLTLPEREPGEHDRADQQQNVVANRFSFDHDADQTARNGQRDAREHPHHQPRR